MMEIMQFRLAMICMVSSLQTFLFQIQVWLFSGIITYFRMIIAGEFSNYRRGNITLRRKPITLTKLHILKTFSLTVECLDRCGVRRSRGYEGHMRQTAKKVAAVSFAVRAQVLTVRLLMSYIYIYIYIYIYMEHPFLMFLDHTQRRTTVGRTPLDE